MVPQSRQSGRSDECHRDKYNQQVVGDSDNQYRCEASERLWEKHGVEVDCFNVVGNCVESGELIVVRHGCYYGKNGRERFCCGTVCDVQASGEDGR